MRQKPRSYVPPFHLAIHVGIACLAIGLLASAAAAQAPVYQTLDADADTPRKLKIEPVLLSRSPTTFSIALVPAGNEVRTVDANGHVWQWPLVERKEPVSVAETNCEPACAALSADSCRLAFAAAEGCVAVMDLDSKQTTFRDDALTDRTVTLAFSPDGQVLAGVTVSGSVRIWETASGKRIHDFAVGRSPVQTVAFSPDGRRLAVASYSHAVTLYGIHERRLPAASEPRVIDAGNSRVTALAFSPDGRQLVIATATGIAKVYDLMTDRESIDLGTYPFAIWSIAFERDGRRMAAGSWDGTIKLWDTSSWQMVQSVKKHEESVAAIAFDDRQGLVSAGLDGRLLSWLPEVDSIRPFATISGRNDSVWIVTYSPDGKWLFVGGRGNRFELWDVDKHELVVTRAGHPTTRCATFSPDGATLATGGDDGSIFLCDAATGQTRTTLLRHPGSVSAVIFADDGRTLVSACDGGHVKVWDTATGQQQASWREHQQQIYCAALSPDEAWLLTGGGNWTTGDPGELLVWERKSGHVRARLVGHRLAVWTIVYMPDGKHFMSSDSSGAVKVWNMETLEEERTLQHSTWVRPLALTSDGKTLAVGRGDGSVRLWDTTSWQERASCDGSKSFLFSLQYAPDGKTLVSGGNDGAVHFWHPSPTSVNDAPNAKNP